MKPTTTDITRALESIEASERDGSHPRAIARRKVKQWKSNAEVERLPLVNQHERVERVLPVDDILTRSYPNQAKDK